MRRRIPVMVVAFVLTSATTVLAYFVGAGSGTASASITTMSVPGSPAAASGNTATVTWTASTINGSVAATSYTVERYSSTGTDLGAASCSPVDSSSGSPNAFGSFSCTDSSGAGTFKYTITAHYNSSWSAATSFTNTATAKNTTAVTAAGPASTNAGSAIAASSISSVLSGATSGGGGTITVTVFGPQATAPTTCTSGGTQVGTTVAVSGNATYHPTASFTPSTAGTYWWYASYSGDSNNAASNSGCGSGMASTIAKSVTSATASGPASGVSGTAIAAGSINSVLSGATSSAGGTVSFTVFGPQTTAPTTCTTGGSQVGGAVTINGNGTYNPSTGFTPTAAGTYWWYASYSGDSNNAASQGTCGTGMASTLVKSATTTTVSAPSTDTVSTAIATTSLSATLAGAGTGGAGTVTFTVFGPQATAPTTCTTGGTQVGTAVPVLGNATYHPTASFTPSTAGTYWWYASYSGDSNNAASNSGCGSGMSSTVAWTGAQAASATDTSTTAHTSTTTSSFTVQPSTTYVLFVFRHSSSSDAISSISSSGLSPSLTTASFTSITSQTYNTSDRAWAYYVTTGSSASGTGTLSVNFASSSNQATILDLVYLQGNSLTSPIVTTNVVASTGSSSTATGNLTNAPAAGDAEVVFLSSAASAGTAAPTATPAMSNLFYSKTTSGSAGSYGGIPAQQNESFALATGQAWGTLAIELNHG